MSNRRCLVSECNCGGEDNAEMTGSTPGPAVQSILDEAKQAVHGARRDSYGHPLDDFSRTAKMWSAILGIEVKPEEVPMCMIALKISRQCNANKRDNLVDMAGYAETAQLVQDEIGRRKTSEPNWREHQDFGKGGKPE